MFNKFIKVLVSIIMTMSLPSPIYSMNLISRANCGNNESITWDPWQTRYGYIAATSFHNWTGGGNSHTVHDDRFDDNAAKAIHWGEGLGMPGGHHWVVSGYHRWGVWITGAGYSGSSYATFCIGS